MGTNKSVLQLANKLKKDYKILLLSKNTRSQFKDVNNKFPELKKVFGKDTMNIWEYNLPKAGKKTIELICKKYNVKPKEILYIDDLQQNLDDPKQLGVKIILYKNFNQIKKEMNKILF